MTDAKHEAPAEGAGEAWIVHDGKENPAPGQRVDVKMTFTTFNDIDADTFDWNGRCHWRRALRARSSAPEAREGAVVGPDSFSAEGKFFLAVDYLTLMTWRWGESCGIDSVGWDDTGDSYNQSCRNDHRKARRAVVDAFHAAVAEKIAASAPSADKLRTALVSVSMAVQLGEAHDIALAALKAEAK